MTTNFPSSKDDFSTGRPTSDQPLSNPNHITRHTNVEDAIEALETKVGTDDSAVTTSLDYLVKNSSSVNPGHKHTLAGAMTDVSITTPSDGDGFTYDATTKKWKNTQTATANASDTTAGVTKLSVAPTTASDPIAVGDNDTRVPSQDENDALAGTSGTPSSTNKYVTDDDTAATSTADKIPRADSNGKIDNDYQTQVDIQTFTSSGTWTKPTGAKKVLIEIWGAGGSGSAGKNYTSGTAGPGGGAGGGEFQQKWFDASDISSTVTVTIGAGGAAVSQDGGDSTGGNDGGNTSFGSYATAHGGKGGNSNHLSDSGGGNGGSSVSIPSLFGTSGSATKNGYYSGAGGDYVSQNTVSNDGGSSFFGGGGGGAGGATNGGTSVYGGAGGDGGNNTSPTAGDGQVPGGGGGSSFVTDNLTATSGKGGDGKAIITTFF